MGENSEASDSYAEAGAALFRLGRLFSRAGGPTQAARHTERAAELSRILIVQAVEAAQAHPGQDVTVGMVAQQLGVEPSTASRLVGDAIREGYLIRMASPLDSRRANLALSDAGRALAEDVRSYQRNVFCQVTRDWSEAERSEFARLFIRFADAVADAVQPAARPASSREAQHEG